MPTPLTLATHDDNGAVTLVATGEVDLSNNAAFTRALTDATAAAASGDRVTVDLRGVEFLDSGAITTLFNHADDIHLIAGPLLMPILTISGLTELATVEQPG
jgi:anti-anti-sigma factor